MSQLSLEEFMKEMGSEPGSSSEEESAQEEVAPKEPQVFSVSDINSAIKSQLENEFSLIWIKGEISNFKPHTSGHFYFTLKDAKSQISAVMFKGFNKQIQFKPADGMEVLVRGKVSVYEPRGSYQIFCEVMEPVGLGALQMAFEQLKKKLQSEGLFDRTKKRPLPKVANKVAIVTSPTGAAIRDMLNVLGRRMKTLDITIFPCSVQGKSATQEIVKAIQAANQIGGFDVMIVGRGGGSIEDLWCFNEEPVARAIAASKIPTVSAVGHEIDFTIADFVADLRAPTPSAAAEIISQSADEVQERLVLFSKSLRLSIYKKIREEKIKVHHLNQKLVDPRRKLQDLILKVDDLQNRLFTSTQRVFEIKKLKLLNLKQRIVSPSVTLKQLESKLQSLSDKLLSSLQKNISFKREKFIALTSKLDSMSPLKVLDRGYSITQNHKKQVLKNSKQVQVGESISVQLLEGSITAEVKKIIN